jgi:cytochrome c oxidase assembly protein subunit 15
MVQSPTHGYSANLDHSVWLHRLAVLTAGATLFLIFVGALVTSKGAGLAVPDWPTTFGHNMFLYPLSKMVGGVFYEHSHRLAGSIVGLFTMGLVLLLWVKESRRWLRWLGVVALIAVVMQGVLGGLRVILLEQTLAVIHAVFAQAFFALMVSLALFTSAGWKDQEHTIRSDDVGRIRRLSVLTSIVIYVQIAFGAVLRHTGTGLGEHLLGAVIVAILLFLLVDLVLKNRQDLPRLVHAANTLRVLLILQVTLGMGAYVGGLMTPESRMASFTVVLLPTVHVVTGALMLATSLVLTLRVYGLSAPRPLADPRITPIRPEGGAEELIA